MNKLIPRVLTTRYVIQSRAGSTKAYIGNYSFDTLCVTSPAQHVMQVQLNRPGQRNALNKDMFRELHEVFKRINDDQHARAVIISGEGKQFCNGMDWKDMLLYTKRIAERKFDSLPQTTPDGRADVARTAKLIRSMLIQFQESFNVIEKCSKPVIGVVHGGCVGAALALLLCSDIRYCSKDAFFQAKEVDTGMAADLGTLQRLPRLLGNDSRAREIIYTCEKVDADEAHKLGLVSKVFNTREDTSAAALVTGKLIASKSPVAVQGSKVLLKYSRDHAVWDGLRVSANWNMAMLQSEDLLQALQGQISGEPVNYNDL